MTILASNTPIIHLRQLIYLNHFQQVHFLSSFRRLVILLIGPFKNLSRLLLTWQNLVTVTIERGGILTEFLDVDIQGNYKIEGVVEQQEQITTMKMQDKGEGRN